MVQRIRVSTLYALYNYLLTYFSNSQNVTVVSTYLHGANPGYSAVKIAVDYSPGVESTLVVDIRPNAVRSLDLSTTISLYYTPITRMTSAQHGFVRLTLYKGQMS